MVGKQLNNFLNRGKLDLVRHWFGQWTNNVKDNASRIKDDFAMFDLAGTLDPNQTVLGIGPGPSLDIALPLLKANPQPFFTVNSALAPIIAAGIRPNITVAIHGEEIVGRQIKAVAHAIEKHDILICPVTIHPSVPDNWPGRVVWFVDHDPAPEYAAVTVSVQAILGKKFMDSLGRLTAGGSVAIQMLEIIYTMGARKIDLIGFEFGGAPRGHNYYSQAHEDCNDQNVPLNRTQGTWIQMKNAIRYRLAAEQRIDYFKENAPEFEARNLSPYSMLEIPYVEAEEVLGLHNGN